MATRLRDRVRARRRTAAHPVSLAERTGRHPLSALREFWFGEAPVAPVAGFRIVFGVLVINCIWQWLPNLTMFFTDEGILPRATLFAHWPDRFSLLHLFGQWWQVAIFWVLSLVAAVMLTIGYRTRLAAIAVFIALMSFQWRNPLTIDGSDYVMRFMAFWLIFTAAGQRWSIDAAILRARGEVPSPLASAFPIRLLELQAGWIYFAGALEKFQGQLWLDGGASYYALRMSHSFSRSSGEFVASNFDLARLFTWGTLVIEFLFVPLTMLTPLVRRHARLLAVIGAGMLQLGILVLMNVGNFPILMLSVLILFAPASRVEQTVAFGGRLFRRSRVTLFYDGSCAFCHRSVGYLDALDSYETLRFVDFRANDAPDIGVSIDRLAQRIHAVDEHGRVRSGLAALALAARGVPVLVPIALIAAIAPLRGALEAGYDWFAARRLPLFCAGADCTVHRGLVRDRLPRRPMTFPRWLTRGALAAVGLAVFLTALPNSLATYRPPEPVYRALIAAGLDQRWSMFSPDPPMFEGWPVVPGVLADGTQYDLMGAWRGTRTDRYADPSFSRWTKVLHEIAYLASADIRTEFGRAYCRTRNLHLNWGESPLVGFDVRYVVRVIPSPERTEVRTDYLLWSHRC